MFDIAFGLLLYHFLMWMIPILLVVFVVVPVVCNLFNGDGYRVNVGYVFHEVRSLLTMAFSKRG